MKTWSEIPGGELNAATQRLWVAFGDNADMIVARINKDPKFVENLAQFAARGHIPTTFQGATPIEITDRQIFEEFNLDPDRIATSLADEAKQLRVDPKQAFLYLQARLPIVVSNSLQAAEKILNTRNVI